MRELAISLSLILAATVCANAQSKNQTPSNGVSVEVKDNTNTSDLDVKGVKAQSATAVDLSNGRPRNSRVIERTPEMLERKKTAPLISDPQ